MESIVAMMTAMPLPMQVALGVVGVCMLMFAIRWWADCFAHGDARHPDETDEMPDRRWFDLACHVERSRAYVASLRAPDVPARAEQARAWAVDRSRRHASAFPAPVIFSPAMSMIGPLAMCSPGIHSG